MSSAVRAVARTILPALVLAAFAREAAAQACFDPGSSRQAVYFNGPNNDISCVLDFTTGQTRSVVTAGGTNFTGLYVLYQGLGSGGGLSIVVGSTTQGGDIEVFGCDANGESCVYRGTVALFSQAGGLALDTFGNLAAVNGTQLLYVPRCTPGDPLCPASGYGVPVGPLAVPGLGQLVDVRFVSNAVATAAGAKYQPGDVLVLGPNQIRAFPATAFDGATIPSTTVVANLPPGAQGTGLALFPKTGEILVPTNNGRLLVFDRNGRLQTTDFGSLAGAKGVSVAIGNTDPRAADPANGAEVFVTTNASGSVRRFVAQRTGAGLVAAGPSQGFATGNPPYGIGNATLTDAAWTGSGTSVKVNPAKAYELLFEKVNAPGFSDSRVYLIPDTVAATAATEAPCNLPVGAKAINGSMVGLPDGFCRQIPSSVQPMNGFYLVHVSSTTADVYGATQEHEVHEEDLGIGGAPYLCDALPARTTGSTQPRLFYATDNDDPAIIEGNRFIDITTGCNSHIGRGGTFSLFLAATDDRGLDAIVAGKLDNLRAALKSSSATAGGYAPFVKKSLQNKLLNNLDKAQAAYSAIPPSYNSSLSYLASMVSTVQANPTSFSRCAGSGTSQVCRNVPGEIVARVESARFMVCGADPGTCSRRLP